MEEETDSNPCLSEREGNSESQSGMLHVNASPKYPDYKLFGKNQKVNEIMKEVFSELLE